MANNSIIYNYLLIEGHSSHDQQINLDKSITIGVREGVFLDPLLHPYDIPANQVRGSFVTEIGGIYPTIDTSIATKLYVDTVASGINWLTPVISRWDASAGLPVGPVLHDRYLCRVAGTGWLLDHIYDWSGAIWTNYTPLAGDTVWVSIEHEQYLYNGITWVIYGSTISHHALRLLTITNDHSQYEVKTELNVLDFGATGDGVTDDTLAIQAALDAVDTVGTDLYPNKFYVVFFPEGTYKIENHGTHGTPVAYTYALRITKSNTILRGIKGKSIIAYDNSLGAANLIISANTVDNIVVEDISLQGVGIFATDGLCFYRCNNVTVRDVVITNVQGDCLDIGPLGLGSYAWGCHDVNIYNCDISNNNIAGQGINCVTDNAVTHENQRIHIYNNYVHHMGTIASNQYHGIYIGHGSQDVEVDSNITSECYGFGIHINDQPPSTNIPTNRNIFVHDNSVLNCGRPQGLGTVVGSVLTDNLKNWIIDYWATPPAGFRLIDSASTVFTIASNTVNTVTVTAGTPVAGQYYITDATGILPSGVRGGIYYNAADCKIYNNFITNSEPYSVSAINASGRHEIYSNIINNVPNHGIYAQISATATGTGGTGGVGTFTVAPSPGWTINGYIGYTLVDSLNAPFTILSNTANVLTLDSVLTPANGSWSITRSKMQTTIRSNHLFNCGGGIRLVVNQDMGINVGGQKNYAVVTGNEIDVNNLPSATGVYITSTATTLTSGVGTGVGTHYTWVVTPDPVWAVNAYKDYELVDHASVAWRIVSNTSNTLILTGKGPAASGNWSIQYYPYVQNIEVSKNTIRNAPYYSYGCYVPAGITRNANINFALNLVNGYNRLGIDVVSPSSALHIGNGGITIDNGNSTITSGNLSLINGYVLINRVTSPIDISSVGYLARTTSLATDNTHHQVSPYINFVASVWDGAAPVSKGVSIQAAGLFANSNKWYLGYYMNTITPFFVMSGESKVGIGVPTQLDAGARTATSIITTGTGGYGTADTLTVTPSPAWVVDAYIGYSLIDNGGTYFTIVSNTANVLSLTPGLGTPDDGDWDISRYGTGGVTTLVIMPDPLWVNNAYQDCTLIDSAGDSFFIASNDHDTLTLTAGTPTDGSWAIWEHGIGTLNTFTVSPDPGWVVNAYAGYYLRDDSNVYFAIVSNTSNALTVSGTPASGDWSIYNYTAFYPTERLHIDSGNIKINNGDFINESGIYKQKDGSYYGKLDYTSSGTILSADKTLTVDLTNSNITLKGNTASGTYTVTVDDWFNQSVKTNADVEHVKLKLTGGASFTKKTVIIAAGLATVDWTTGNKQVITLTDNVILTFTNPIEAANLIFVIKQDGTGGRIITWPALYWAGGVPITLSIAPNKRDIVSFYWDGTDYYAVGANNFILVP